MWPSPKLDRTHLVKLLNPAPMPMLVFSTRLNLTYTYEYSFDLKRYTRRTEAKARKSIFTNFEKNAKTCRSECRAKQFFVFSSKFVKTKLRIFDSIRLVYSYLFVKSFFFAPRLNLLATPITRLPTYRCKLSAIYEYLLTYPVPTPYLRL